MKITFVGPLVSTFVRNDITILSRVHQLTTIDANLGKGKSAALRLIVLHLRILLSLLSSDALFFWFADYYTLIPSLFARLLGKKVFVVAGGFDITYLPKLGIGARTRPWRWFAVKNTFKIASHIFPVSQDTQNDLDSGVPGHAPSTMIYNAVDTGLFCYRSGQRRLRVLTVSQADSLPEYKRKGIDLLISLASSLPDVEFHIVGLRGPIVHQAKKDAERSPNVQVIPGRVDIKDLLNEFWEASVYCQLSIEERFGVSVAEAMSCGCIPVVTPVNALIEVVGTTGYIVDITDKNSQIAAIRSGLNANEAQRREVSNYAKQFDIEARAFKLLAMVR